ncbi:pantothenate kinase [Taibaiella sp. KBW10]|uniref:type III pantothenate kinase n=1 Tax=Taibaiella sp. KBW10 TaxID=2153357 RepID=UPI000F5B7957|nr:type III pantothenate kinase [Taibaiella sp. KBW10]RQO30840.1 pantothenate kinase [Taibaiella sp. KBW10]
MNLCLDFGNSTCKAALFENDQLVERFSFSAAEAEQAIEDILNTYHPQNAILSSVINHPESIHQKLSEKCSRVIVLNGNTPLPIVNAYASPSTLGMDRVALAVAGQHHYADRNCLVISLGTAITYNFITYNKFFRGGAISPGMRLRFEALNTQTDKLPLIEDMGYIQLLGYDTESSIKSGVINGIVGEINYFIEEYAATYENLAVILTGGNLSFFENRIKNQIFADSKLLFKGLNLILNYNAQ